MRHRNIKNKKKTLFIGHSEVANLFLVENFEEYSSNISIQHLNPAISAYPFLDGSKVKTWFELIYRRTDFIEVSGTIHLLKFLIENNLRQVFSDTFFNHVHNKCLRSTMSQDRLTALAIFWKTKDSGYSKLDQEDVMSGWTRKIFQTMPSSALPLYVQIVHIFKP